MHTQLKTFIVNVYHKYFCESNNPMIIIIFATCGTNFQIIPGTTRLTFELRTCKNFQHIKFQLLYNL